MSTFSTTIPVDVEDIIRKLPARSHVHSVKLGPDRQSVIIEWDCDEWRTPYSVSVNVTEAMLDRETVLPDCVAPHAGFKRVLNDDVAPKGKSKANKTQ